jgi:hypothetical protein
MKIYQIQEDDTFIKGKYCNIGVIDLKMMGSLMIAVLDYENRLTEDNIILKYEDAKKLGMELAKIDDSGSEKV